MCNEYYHVYCYYRYKPSKHAGSGSVFVTASYGHYGQRAARIGPDSLCQIRHPASVSFAFFQRRPGPHCAKPTRIRSGWPGQGLAKRIWSGSKLVCRNHLAWFLAERNRSITSFPLSDSVPSILPQTSRIILCKASPDPV